MEKTTYTPTLSPVYSFSVDEKIVQVAVDNGAIIALTSVGRVMISTGPGEWAEVPTPANEERTLDA